MDDHRVYEGIMAGLLDALAFQNGDKSRGRVSLRDSSTLTPAQIAELDAAQSSPIVYDGDSPRLTPEELSEFRRVSDHRNPRNQKSQASGEISAGPNQ